MLHRLRRRRIKAGEDHGPTRFVLHRLEKVGHPVMRGVAQQAHGLFDRQRRNDGGGLLEFRPGDDRKRLGLRETGEQVCRRSHVECIHFLDTFHDRGRAEAGAEKIAGDLSGPLGKALDIHFARLSVDRPPSWPTGELTSGVSARRPLGLSQSTVTVGWHRRDDSVEIRAGKTAARAV